MALSGVKLPYRRKVTGQTATGNRRSKLFAARVQTLKEAENESVKSECSTRGYRLLGKTLGEGAYAKVTLADVSAAKLARSQHLADSLDDSRSYVAIKVINKKVVPKEFLRKFLPRELDNHTTLPLHPNVVQVFETFSTPDQVYLVLEYCERGDLLDMINGSISSKQRGLGEENTKHLFSQMCQGVQHIHNHFIVHRDLKCENILLTEERTVKITDFGFSCQFHDRNELLKTSCGSYAYTAPEVIKNKLYDGYKADVWSIGIILFAMVNGRLPYNDSQLTEMDEDMKMQRLRFERSVSFDCMVLIRKMLQYSPILRPSISEVLADPWITGKKPIPRMLHKPKWINPYGAKKDSDNNEKDKLYVSGEGTQNPNPPLCYHGDYPERSKTITTPKATVVVNQKAGETVTLKSRMKNQIPEMHPTKADVSGGESETSDPESRPQTWPKSEKDMRKEADRLPKRRPKNNTVKKNDQTQAIARLTQLLELTKGGAVRQEIGADHGESSVPLWYMYKILQNSCKPTGNKSPGKAETGSGGQIVTPAEARKRYNMYSKSRRKEGGTVKLHVDTKNKKNNGGTVRMHVDLTNSEVMEKRPFSGQEDLTHTVMRTFNSPTFTPRTVQQHLKEEPANRSQSCRERFVKVCSTKPSYIKDIPLPPLMVQRLRLQDNASKARKNCRSRKKPNSAPVTGNTSPEAVKPASNQIHASVTSPVNQSYASSISRYKPVYKVIHHTG